jgi:hypothetical protein
MNHPDIRLRSADVQAQIDKLLLANASMTMSQAENAFLDAHLDDIAELAATLSDAEFQEHEAVKLLLSHGSRSWEDCLK